ncbi:hypothetical protein ABVF11_01745 [Pediococcus argentinicus]|uniref:hypothetical protein n=1 Tax=Pediococcus argentinicus TaxID=480391 RepID=UPI0033901EBB
MNEQLKRLLIRILVALLFLSVIYFVLIKLKVFPLDGHWIITTTLSFIIFFGLIIAFQHFYTKGK